MEGGRDEEKGWREGGGGQTGIKRERERQTHTHTQTCTQKEKEGEGAVRGGGGGGKEVHSGTGQKGKCVHAYVRVSE